SEDGIRDSSVTGVQTCALPIYQIAGWFHAHLSQALVNLLRVLSEPGSAQWIGVVLFLAVVFLVWKRAWPALVTIVVAVPGGMLQIGRASCRDTVRVLTRGS